MGRVLLEDVTLYEAKNIKDRIADVDGVDMVMWCDTTTNIYGSSQFIDYEDIEDYYKDCLLYTSPGDRACIKDYVFIDPACGTAGFLVAAGEYGPMSRFSTS